MKNVDKNVPNKKTMIKMLSYVTARAGGARAAVERREPPGRHAPPPERDRTRTHETSEKFGTGRS